MTMRERTGAEVLVVGTSGGKDSTATCLHLRELGLECRRVFSDTGWEHPDTYEYLDYLEGKLGKIDRVAGALGFADLVRKKGMFPGRLHRFCTTELKVKPIQKYLEAIDDEVINVVGIRAAESEARSKLEEYEWSDGFDCWVWRPLIRWTEDEVIAIHKRHDIKPNPLYLKGATRVGCFPCLYARKSELRLVAELWPERIEQIRALEKEAAETATARYEARGETFETLGYNPPTMFTHRENGRVVMFPIDDAVEWAKTSHGGRQYQLFNEDSRDGCVRWGLCETEPDDG